MADSFVTDLRDFNVAPHVAQNTTNRAPGPGRALDDHVEGGSRFAVPVTGASIAPTMAAIMVNLR